MQLLVHPAHDPEQIFRMHQREVNHHPELKGRKGPKAPRLGEQLGLLVNSQPKPAFPSVLGHIVQDVVSGTPELSRVPL